MANPTLPATSLMSSGRSRHRAAIHHESAGRPAAGLREGESDVSERLRGLAPISRAPCAGTWSSRTTRAALPGRSARSEASAVAPMRPQRAVAAAPSAGLTSVPLRLTDGWSPV